MSHKERKETLFETSLKSQDDFCIKYQTFKDDINGDAQTIEKVIQKSNFRIEIENELLYKLFVRYII